MHCLFVSNSLCVSSLNGRDLGVAFVGFDMEGLYPAASMNVGQAAHFNFGHSSFLYTPTDAGGSSFQPVSEAVAITTVESNPNSGDCTRPCGQSLLDISGDLREDRAEDEQVGVDAQGDATEPSPRRIRGSRDIAIGTGRHEARPYAIDGDGSMQGGGNEGSSHLELERQRLVENLIGMGFPVEWAIRAAGRPGE